MALDVCVMIEGQDGVNWDTWKRLVRTVEDAGFDGLFRSDHFTNPDGPVEDSLELWTSLTWLAEETESIDFGPLVTPVSFRHPVWTARMGKEVDNLADGRLALGIGAGWQEREHATFGFDLLEPGPRFDRFEEGVEVITRLLREDDPVSFDGEYYQLEGAQFLPRPERAGGTRVLIGGNGAERTLPLAAAYADEWNGVYLPADRYESANEYLDGLVADAGRDPADLTRSLMTRVVFGRDDEEVADLLDDEDVDELDEQGAVVGTESEVAAQLDRLAAAGADRVMLQWLEPDDLDRLEALADAVL